MDDVNLDIQDGEFFTMLGPSGSGKTTCLRLIAGFERPDLRADPAARARMSRTLPPYERDVNTVFQDYALFPHMTVGENIAYGLMIQQGAQSRARAAGRRDAGSGAPGRAGPAGSPPSSPAGSASGWPWRGR